MCKIKSLTKDDKLFSILLVFNLLLSYFTGYSFLWMLYEFFVTTGIYYLCFKSPITEKFSKLTKTVIGICLVTLLAAPPLFIFLRSLIFVFFVTLFYILVCGLFRSLVWSSYDLKNSIIIHITANSIGSRQNILLG